MIGDEVVLRIENDVVVRLVKNFVEARGFERKVFPSDKTHYSKKTICLKTSNDALDISKQEVSLSKRFVFNMINTGVGSFFVLIFPGDYKYDRLIANERYLCIEHSREEKITVSGETIIILF